MATGQFGRRGQGFGKGEVKSLAEGQLLDFFFVVVLLVFLESEVAGTGVAVVVQLLLDVDHVAAGVFQLSELGSATEVSKVAELRQP